MLVAVIMSLQIDEHDINCITVIILVMFLHVHVDLFKLQDKVWRLQEII